MDHDILQRFLFAGSPVRGELVRLEAAWRAVLDCHDYPPGVRRLLAELMVSSVLLAATLKYEGRLIMQIQGDGPVHLLVAECHSGRTVRGLAQWHGDVSDEIAIGAAAGRAQLVITMDPTAGRQRYQSIVALEGDTIAQALEVYLSRSEQIATGLWIVSDGSRAAGLLLQRLPGEPADADLWDRVNHLASTLSTDELLRASFRTLLHRLYHEEDVLLFDPAPVSFRCTCSRERVQDMLRTLGEPQVREILTEQGSVGVHCEFCNRYYRFDDVDVSLLFVPAPPGHPPLRH